MVKYWASWTLIAGLALPALSAAQPNPEDTAPPTPPATSGGQVDACVAPSPEDTEAAKRAFRDGQSSFSEGDYAHAAELWRWAYERDCTAHALLLNLAMAQELLGRPDLAIESLSRFDRSLPDSPYVAANQKRIARLERAPVAAVRPRRELPKACPPAPPPVPATQLAAPAGRSWLPLGVALGGAAATLVGGAFYLEARHAASGADEACGGRASQCDNLGAVVDGERARARAQTAGWITGVGLGTLAGGLVWHLATPGEAEGAPAAASKSIGMTLGGNVLGLSLSGGF
jgi:hypothetical protein